MQLLALPQAGALQQSVVHIHRFCFSALVLCRGGSSIPSSGASQLTGCTYSFLKLLQRWHSRKVLHRQHQGT